MKHNLESLLQKSDELPSLPEVYFRVNELIDDKHANAQQIGGAVQTDPSLTAKVLKMINSAYYGLPNPVSTVSQAVSLLGRQQLQQILMGSLLAGIFVDVNIEKFALREFWEHSVKTAIIARHLAMQNANILDHESFFTAGLLHDIGRLVIAKVAPEPLMEIDALVRDQGLDIIETEIERLGVSHVAVGAALMRKWQMPSLLSLCVEYHHQDQHSGPFAIETAIVYLANQLSRFERPADEDGMQELLAHIPNWQSAACPLDQVFVACRLADEQWFDVMDSLGMLGIQQQAIAG